MMIKKLRKSIIGLATGALAFVAGAVEVDGIAARVGTETILKSDVALEMARLRMPSTAYSQVRNEMIDRKLILRAASEAKVTLQDWIVENRIREIIQRSFGGDRNKLMETLSRQKVSEAEWRSRMKDDMIIAAMQWNVITKNVTARPGMMRKQYAEHPERYTTGTKMTVSVILLKPEDAGKRDMVAASLATNDFAAVAREYSADGKASEGGVWKDVDPAEVFREEICEELVKLPRGTFSRWIELDGWSFLLRKDAETPGKLMSFSEAYTKVEQDVKDAATKTAYAEWIARLRSETYIKVY